MTTIPNYSPFYQAAPSQQQMMAQALMNQNMQNQQTQATAPVSPASGLNQLSHLPPGAFGLGGQPQQPGQAINSTPWLNGTGGALPQGATDLGASMPWLG